MSSNFQHDEWEPQHGSWVEFKLNLELLLDQHGFHLEPFNDDYLEIKGLAKKVLITMWRKNNDCEYTIAKLEDKVDIILLPPLQPPLSLRMEEIRANAQIIVVPNRDEQIAPVLETLIRFQEESISRLRSIFIQSGLINLWELLETDEAMGDYHRILIERFYELNESN